MSALKILIGVVFLATFLSSPTLGAGWFWDLGNALGFAAMAGLLYLTLATGPGLKVRLHRQLGYAVLGVAVAHALWLLVGDPAVVEYLKPGAPLYMWAGVLGLLLLAALTVIAMPHVRSRLHKRYSGFRLWHRVLAILTIIGAAGHIAGSNYYIDSGYAAGVFVIVVVAVTAGHRRLPGYAKLTTTITTEFLVVSAGAIVLFVGLRNLLH
jgi:hypothetical protein